MIVIIGLVAFVVGVVIIGWDSIEKDIQQIQAKETL